MMQPKDHQILMDGTVFGGQFTRAAALRIARQWGKISPLVTYTVRKAPAPAKAPQEPPA